MLNPHFLQDTYIHFITILKVLKILQTLRRVQYQDLNGELGVTPIHSMTKKNVNNIFCNNLIIEKKETFEKHRTKKRIFLKIYF